MKSEIKDILIKLHESTNAPLTFLDIESTGLDKVTDEIIQIYLCKYDGIEFTEHKSNYDVVAEITEEAFEKHGLTKEDLEGLPFFKEDAQMIYDNFLTQGVVICGFNSNKFDIPFIIEKMLQSKIVEAVSITRNKTIDAILIYRELYPNTLEGIHKRLVGKELENSHDAKEDIYGTIRILDALLKVHPDISLVTTSETIDAGGFFKRVENNVFFDKGKLKGQNILTMDKTEATGFLGWMTRTSSISIHSRTIAQKLIDKLVPTTV